MERKSFAVGAVDALGRKLPLEAKKRADKKVGLFYFLWNGEHGNPDELKVQNISDILRKDPQAGYKPDDKIWGTEPVLYYWGKPIYGYYLSREKWVMSKHVELFVQADIDFLLFDTTNAFTYPDVAISLMEVLEDGRKQGFKVPQIGYFTNSYAGETAQRIYEEIYKKNVYPDLWYCVDGKPLLITHEGECSAEIKQFFTIREAQWPIEPDRENAFPWISFIMPQTVYYDKDGNHGVISVSPAQHPQLSMGDSALYGETGNRSRSYYNGENHITDDSKLYGYNYQEQWNMAIESDAETVFLTGWNEWTMNRIQGSKERPILFVDNADEEYSRDIEPMDGALQDNYYMQTVSNIRRFKGYDADLYSVRIIANNSDIFEQAEAVPEICPFHPAVTLRQFPGYEKMCFEDFSAVNRFVSLKLLQDEKNVYFLASTEESLLPWKQGVEVRLFCSDEKNKYLVRIESATQEVNILSVINGKENRIGKADIIFQENNIAVELPKVLFHNIIYFQWTVSDIPIENTMDLYLHGGCAPVGRFKFAAKL